MRSAWVVLLALCLPACARGCHRLGHGAAGADSGNVVQPRMNGGEPAQIEFVIDSVYAKQELSASPPWHAAAAAGEWTFFDAHLGDGARFGFGWKARPATEGMGFGQALWTVPDRKFGALLVERFARTFHGKLPAPSDPQPLRARPFSLVVLGDGIGRDDEGAFRGNGSWQATKLFLQRPGLEAELFFNFDLAHKRGEFAEKDSDYASDLLAFMALELRDGPPAPLTPDNDARISLLGPKPDATRPIGPPDARFLRFEAKSQRLLYAAPDAGGTRVASVAVEGDPRELQLIRLEHELSLLECAAGSDDPCLVEESTPDKPHVISSKDKKSLFLLERAHQRVTPLSGPWGEQGHLSSASVSPDGNWLAVHGLRPKAKPPTNFQVLYLLRTSAPQPALEVSQGEEWLEVVGWFGAGAQTRAVVRVGLSYDKDVKPKWLALDPKTGEKVELAKAPDGVAADDTLSPDGKRRFSCQGDNAVVITDVATGAEHKFPIAARERRAFAEECGLAWRGSRYLSYAPERTGFIDVDTLKLSFPFAEGAEPEPQEYDPSFSWLVTKPDKQLEIARLVVR